MSEGDKQFKGFIFDLDGVLVDTTEYHFQAWQNVAAQLGFEFTQQHHEHLHGVSRMNSLEKILDWGNIYMTEAEKLHWSDVKNNLYINLIATMKPEEVLPGVLAFLKEVKNAGIITAVVSSSKNARAVLRSTQLEPYFDVVIDGNLTKKSKPDPERFILAGLSLHLSPGKCLVFEDAPAGIDGALAGGFTTVGVGSPEYLSKAHITIPGFENLHLPALLHRLAAPSQKV